MYLSILCARHQQNHKIKLLLCVGDGICWNFVGLVVQVFTIIVLIGISLVRTPHSHWILLGMVQAWVVGQKLLNVTF